MMNYFEHPISNHSYAFTPWQIRHEQEMRNRRAAELEYRRRQEEAIRREVLRQEQEQELQRRLYQQEQQELEYQRRNEQRRQLQAERRRLAQERAAMRTRGPELREWNREEEHPLHSIVRGPDGRLYRVVERPGMKSLPATQRDGQEQAAPATSDPTMYHTTQPSATVITEGKSRQTIETPTKQRKGRRSKKVTVIVEDASDSENEGGDLGSVWRNRLPSPGQWMEPVAVSK